MNRFEKPKIDSETNPSLNIEAGYQELSPELREAFLHSWSKTISGEEYQGTVPSSGVDFINTLEKIVDSSLEGHVDFLAKQQGKELPLLPTLSPEATSQEQLAYLTSLTQRIHAVQNGNSAGITPRLSKELNSMDCSMSTWVMKHELKKTNIKFVWGTPVEHAVGIVQLADKKIYYADGQNGFVEEINGDITLLPHGGHVIEANNYQEIQSRRPAFFPRHVFVFKNGGVASTVNNLDSMLYKQHIGQMSEEQRKAYGEDAKIVDQLQPYAKEYQTTMKKFATETTNSEKDEQSPLNLVSDKLFFAEEQSHNSPEAKEETERLKRNWANYHNSLPLT